MKNQDLIEVLTETLRRVQESYNLNYGRLSEDVKNAVDLAIKLSEINEPAA